MGSFCCELIYQLTPPILPRIDLSQSLDRIKHRLAVQEVAYLEQMLLLPPSGKYHYRAEEDVIFKLQDIARTLGPELTRIELIPLMRHIGRNAHKLSSVVNQIRKLIPLMGGYKHLPCLYETLIYLIAMTPNGGTNRVGFMNVILLSSRYQLESSFIPLILGLAEEVVTKKLAFWFFIELHGPESVVSRDGLRLVFRKLCQPLVIDDKLLDIQMWIDNLEMIQNCCRSQLISLDEKDVEEAVAPLVLSASEHESESVRLEAARMITNLADVFTEQATSKIFLPTFGRLLLEPDISDTILVCLDQLTRKINTRSLNSAITSALMQMLGRFTFNTIINLRKLTESLEPAVFTKDVVRALLPKLLCAFEGPKARSELLAYMEAMSLRLGPKWTGAHLIPELVELAEVVMDPKAREIYSSAVHYLTDRYDRWPHWGDRPLRDLMRCAVDKPMEWWRL